MPFNDLFLLDLLTEIQNNEALNDDVEYEEEDE